MAAICLGLNGVGEGVGVDGLWFYVEATLRINCTHNNSKSTEWIVLKFGAHSGSDSALNWSVNFSWSCVKVQGHTITTIGSFCHF